MSPIFEGALTPERTALLTYLSCKYPFRQKIVLAYSQSSSAKAEVGLSPRPGTSTARAKSSYHPSVNMDFPSTMAICTLLAAQVLRP